MGKNGGASKPSSPSMPGAGAGAGPGPNALMPKPVTGMLTTSPSMFKPILVPLTAKRSGVGVLHSSQSGHGQSHEAQLEGMPEMLIQTKCCMLSMRDAYLLS